MFADELAGNTSRKRQDEAKARRRQLKQQQIQQKQKEKLQQNRLPTTASLSNVVASAVSNFSPIEIPVSTPDEGQSSVQVSAITHALQQRQLRQKSQLQIKSITRIQAFFRAHKSNSELLKNQAQLLSTRLKDLIVLVGLLKQKMNTEYIPPQATASALVLQLLFITKTSPFKKPQSAVIRTQDDIVRIHQVIQYVLLPGICGDDANLDPILPWPASRFLEFIRVVLLASVHPGVSNATLAVTDTFLRTIIGIGAGKARQQVTEEARHHLFPLTPLQFALEEESSHDLVRTSERKPYPHERVGSTVDLLLILRHHLLFSKGDPIPGGTTAQREKYFTEGERRQSDMLNFLAVDGVMSAEFDSCRLHARFLTEILTIPLLTWKTSINSTTKLLSGSPTPILLVLITSVVKQHAATLSAGKIRNLLPAFDVPLTACPATASQCLLANLVQIGRLCPLINGSTRVDYQQAALFFNFLATLLDVVPLGTLSMARESAIEWMSDGKSHLTAIVLSPVILDQCKYIVHDSFVRDLFLRAIDDVSMGTEQILNEKTQKDLKLEKDLFGTVTANSLASKEARVDRSKRFWNSSNWANNIKKKVSKMLAGDDPAKDSKSPSQKGLGGLANMSSTSRRLAEGSSLTEPGPHEEGLSQGSTSKISPFSPTMYFALCRMYAIILARWGGGGRDDIVGRRTSDEALQSMESRDKKHIATLNADPCTSSLLNALSFSTPIIRTAWAQIQSDGNVIKGLYMLIDPTKGQTPLRLLSAPIPWGPDSGYLDGAAQLLIFLSTLGHALIITDDVEIHDMDKPIPLHQLRRCIQLLKTLLYRACWLDLKASLETECSTCYFGLSIISAAAKTMRDLYDRSSRRPLCLPKLWIVEDLLEKDLNRCKSHDEYVKLLSEPVLRICPYLVSFKRRLKLFERIVTTNRIEIQGQQNTNPFSSESGFKPGISVRIMRGRVLEDGLLTMNKLGKNMRKRLIVHYLNEAGAQEAGIDVGGLFKEFWTDLCAIAFDPNYALFRITDGPSGCMYPNPASDAAHGSDHVVLFEFLGRILGKALYEGITIRPQFAHFFLSFLRGDYNFLHMLPDLSTMDSQLYNNLMFLKNYDGDAEDLCLTFTVANDDFGGNQEIPLIPDGASVAVTNANKQRFVGLVAKYRLYDRLKEQSQAFTRGLWDVIERPWLQLFNEPELQILISGPCDGGIDINDMRMNTRYAGGFTGLDRTVNRFWNVMTSFTSDEQASLLRFVTSCERPPPLGFASMNPPFTIQRIGILRDGDKLPTASTCFNTLKLPTYSSEKVMKERLLYSIQSGAGFELS